MVVVILENSFVVCWIVGQRLTYFYQGRSLKLIVFRHIDPKHLHLLSKDAYSLSVICRTTTVHIGLRKMAFPTYLRYILAKLGQAFDALWVTQCQVIIVAVISFPYILLPTVSCDWLCSICIYIFGVLIVIKNFITLVVCNTLSVLYRGIVEFIKALIVAFSIMLHQPALEAIITFRVVRFLVDITLVTEWIRFHVQSYRWY
jgi:hypothetical protein